jgi:SAM-dependent methyltransferase
MSTPIPHSGFAWQESWDRQQSAYLPDREGRFSAMLDTVEAVAGSRAPAILDLAGGTGSISLRALRRFPDAATTLLDVDPVLMAIARATLDERCTFLTADLRTPEWIGALPRRDFDAVLTSTALHWLDADRLGDVYAQIRTVLRPGGVFINADHMPDDGLPGLSARMDAREQALREARIAAGAAMSWAGWWEHAARDPVLGPLVSERDKVFAQGHSTEFEPPVSWHLDALRTAGFSEVGLIWRGARDAAVAAVG